MPDAWTKGQSLFVHKKWLDWCVWKEFLYLFSDISFFSFLVYLIGWRKQSCLQEKTYFIFCSCFSLALGFQWSHVLCLCSDIYPSLERICLEGTRAESKLAVSAIAALSGSSEQYIFSELCKVWFSKPDWHICIFMFFTTQ